MLHLCRRHRTYCSLAVAPKGSSGGGLSRGWPPTDISTHLVRLSKDRTFPFIEKEPPHFQGEPRQFMEAVVVICLTDGANNGFGATVTASVVTTEAAEAKGRM